MPAPCGREQRHELLATQEAAEERAAHPVRVLGRFLVRVELADDEHPVHELVDIANDLGELLGVGVEPCHAHGTWYCLVACVVDGQDVEEEIFLPRRPGRHLGVECFALGVEFVVGTDTGFRERNHGSGRSHLLLRSDA